MLMWRQPPSAVGSGRRPDGVRRCDCPGIAIIETSVALSPQSPPSAPANRPLPSGKDASLHQFFGPGGVLSRTHPASASRRGHLQMAQAVAEPRKDNRHQLHQASTGTGKALAYLVPVIRSGKRVI